MSEDFEINSTTPPEGSEPDATNYRYILPEPTGNDGNGNPVGAVGKPAVELRFARLSADGWSWYATFTGDSPSVALTSLTVYNPYKSGGAGWETYSSAIMHRPAYGGMTWGQSFTDVTILFSELAV